LPVLEQVTCKGALRIGDSRVTDGSSYLVDEGHNEKQIIELGGAYAFAKWSGSSDGSSKPEVGWPNVAFLGSLIFSYCDLVGFPGLYMTESVYCQGPFKVNNHEHAFSMVELDDGWKCSNGADCLSGCGSECHTSHGLDRYRCTECKFDLCGKCLDSSRIYESEKHEHPLKLRHAPCTYTQSGSTFRMQKVFDCETCQYTHSNNQGVCEACINTCHKGHNITNQRMANFYCDCGALNDQEHKCKVLGDGKTFTCSHCKDTFPRYADGYDVVHGYHCQVCQYDECAPCFEANRKDVDPEVRARLIAAKAEAEAAKAAAEAAEREEEKRKKQEELIASDKKRLQFMDMVPPELVLLSDGEGFKSSTDAKKGPAFQSNHQRLSIKIDSNKVGDASQLTVGGLFHSSKSVGIEGFSALLPGFHFYTLDGSSGKISDPFCFQFGETPVDPNEPKKNDDGRDVSLGSSGYQAGDLLCFGAQEVYYCGQRRECRCGGCSSECGSSYGCPCLSCKRFLLKQRGKKKCCHWSLQNC